MKLYFYFYCFFGRFRLYVEDAFCEGLTAGEGVQRLVKKVFHRFFPLPRKLIELYGSVCILWSFETCVKRICPSSLEDI